MDLYRYNKALNEKVGKKRAKTHTRIFESSVSAESDAATSGVAFKAAQNGTLEEAARFMLITGVITNTGLNQLLELDSVKNDIEKKKVIKDMQSGKTVASLQGLNEAGITIRDAYQQTVINFLESLDKDNKALLTVLELVYGKLLNNDGSVSKIGRDFAKQPQMQFLYGQKEGSLSNYMGSLASDNLVEQLTSNLENRVIKSKNLKKLLKTIREAIKSELSTLQSVDDKYSTKLNDLLLSEERINVLVKLAPKSDEAAAEAVENVRNAVGLLVGGGLFNALTGTFKDLSTHDEVVVEAYNTTFVLSEALRKATDLANNEQSPIGMPKEYRNELSDEINSLFEFTLGSKDEQQLAVNKQGLDSSPYESGMADNSILEGGNQQIIQYGVTAEGKPRTISVRASTPSRASASSSILPVDTHNRDAVAMMDAIIELRINQIYDAAVASGTDRVAAEILTDIGFYEQTFGKDHVVDYALDAVNRALGVYTKNSTVPKEVERNLKTSIAQVAKSNGLAKTLGTESQVNASLSKLKKKLEAAKVEIDKNRQDKIDDLNTISNYGVNSKLVFKKGELVAFTYSSNGVTTTVTELDGHPIKGMDLAEVKHKTVEYFKEDNFNDTNSGVDSHISSSDITVKKTVSMIQQKLADKVASKKKQDKAAAVDEKISKSKKDKYTEEYMKKKAKEASLVPTEVEYIQNAIEIASDEYFANLTPDEVDEIFNSISGDEVLEAVVETEAEEKESYI